MKWLILNVSVAVAILTFVLTYFVSSITFHLETFLYVGMHIFVTIGIILLMFWLVFFVSGMIEMSDSRNSKEKLLKLAFLLFILGGSLTLGAVLFDYWYFTPTYH